MKSNTSDKPSIHFDKYQRFMTNIFGEKSLITDEIAIAEFNNQSANFTQAAYQEISKMLLSK